MSITAGLEARFWDRVDQSGDCWIWTGGKGGGGKAYGVIGHGNKVVYAHRLSYEISNGPIPAGMVIDHMCHTPACVNPAHLRAASQKQNTENPKGNCSSTGIRGVYPSGKAGKFQVKIMHNRKSLYFGVYATLAEAESVAIAKRNELFTHNDLDRVR